MNWRLLRAYDNALPSENGRSEAATARTTTECRIRHSPLTIVGSVERRRCGRPTRSGEPCAASVRYSVALRAFAPACKKHLTTDERNEVDSNPLWSDNGQVLWVLEQRGQGEEPLMIREVAARSQLQQPAASHALRRLVDQGQAKGCDIDGSLRWGTVDHITKWIRDRERERIHSAATAAAAVRDIEERNKAVQEASRRLREVCIDQSIDVSVFDVTAGTRYPPEHALMLTTHDPEAAAWLLNGLSRLAPGENESTDDE